MTTEMLVVTTEAVAGSRIVKHYGLVSGGTGMLMVSASRTAVTIEPG